jgi:hypothetical protein
MPNDAITPFILAVPQADLEDLNRHIDQTRWPDGETVDDWTGRPARHSQLPGSLCAKGYPEPEHCPPCPSLYYLFRYQYARTLAPPFSPAS